MKPTSRTHLAAAEELLADALAPINKGHHGSEKTMELAEQFFVFSDALSSSAQLRNLLSDSDTSDEVKIHTLNQLLGDKADPVVLGVIKKLTLNKWGSDLDYQESVEQLGQDTLLYAAAKENNLEEIETQIFHLGHQLRRYPDAVDVLADVKSNEKEREGVIRSLLQAKPNPITVLLSKRAAVSAGPYLDHLNDVGTALAAKRRLTVAHVTSAVELSAAQTERLERILSEKYGRAIQVVTVIDPEIIGGLRVEIGPYIIDDTIRARLADVERRLA